jgi:hypothetical protein
MNWDKRSPVIALGIFLFFAAVLPCGAIDGLSLSGKTGVLWAEQDGTALYWDAGLSYKSGSLFFVEANTGQLVSTLPEANGDIDVVRYRGGIDSKKIGFSVSGGFFHHNFFNADFGNSRFYNDGGRGHVINSTLQVHLGPVDISPSFLFGQGGWDQGSFYWFFGKFDIPALYGYGLSATYKNRHFLRAGYYTSNLNILGNNGEELFTAGVDGFMGSYTLKGEKKDMGFEGTIGWFYTAGSAEGALTMSNQNYALFPFRFFNMTGSMNMHLGYGLGRFLYARGFFHVDISLGAANIFGGAVDAAAHYQMKQLFGGTESHAEIGPVSLANTGALFLLLGAGLEPSTGKTWGYSLRFDLQKTFILPWGYEKLINPGAGDSGPSSPAGGPEMWRTILLSGLSCCLKLSW